MRKYLLKISAVIALILILAVTVVIRKNQKTMSMQSVPTTRAVTIKPLNTMEAPAGKDQVLKIPSAPLPQSLPLTSEDYKQLSKQLELFQELDVKVLMNPNEKERYVAILNNKDTQKLIQRAIISANTENIKLQNSAVEFLVSAIESQIDVSQLIKNIVSDPAIESASTPQAQRQVQAELKAELLYSWSSYNPQQAQGVEALLPGPVSQRIWSNIQNTHANNAEESLIAN